MMSFCDAVVEAERLENQIERLPHGDVLEIPDEVAFGAWIRNDAQAGVAHQQHQDVADWRRRSKGQRQALAIELRMTLARVELGDRHRLQPGGGRRLLRGSGGRAAGAALRIA